MSDQTSTTTRLGGLSERQVTLPISAVIALAAGLGGGWTGGNAASAAASAAVEKLELALGARLSSLEREIQRQEVDRSESRGQLRALELWRAKVEAREEAARGATPR